MESPKKIAHEIGGVKRDALRFGLNGVKSDIVGSHPLESSYESVIQLFFLFLWFSRLQIESVCFCVNQPKKGTSDLLCIASTV